MEPALGDASSGSGLRRWGPLAAIAAIVAIVIGVIVFAGGGGEDDEADTDVSRESPTEISGRDNGDDSAAEDTGDGSDTEAPTTVAGETPDPDATPDTGLFPGVMTFDVAQELGLDEDFGERCDPETGRVKVPSFFAPPCYLPFEGDNGGATAPGVTQDSIKIVFWQAQEADPILNYVTDAINNDDTNAQIEETLRRQLVYYETYYETYGRSVDFVFVEGSGTVTDTTSARADAVKIAEEIEPFMVWGGPSLNNAFAEELAARGIPCIGCGPGQPYDFYEESAPYIWTLTQGPQQTNRLVAEYVGRQLAGRPAEHAGDEELHDKERVFARVWIEASRNSPILNEEFTGLLAEQGVELVESLSYALDPATIQESAATVIAKLKEADVTTVIFTGDPVAPRDFTREATAQGYFPEWVLGGSVLLDTTVFARTYDPEQWPNAFGLSTLSARVARERAGAYFVHEWFNGSPPPADDSIGVIDPFPGLFYAVLSAIGPEVTVENWEAALFAADPTARAITAPTISFGEQGRWPAELEPDYFGVDDITVIWWDPDLVGVDELGREAPGMYQYTDSGKRYLLGEFPTEPLPIFDASVAVARLSEPPPDEPRILYDPLPPS